MTLLQIPTTCTSSEYVYLQFHTVQSSAVANTSLDTQYMYTQHYMYSRYNDFDGHKRKLQYIDMCYMYHSPGSMM